MHNWNMPQTQELLLLQSMQVQVVEQTDEEKMVVLSGCWWKWWRIVEVVTLAGPSVPVACWAVEVYDDGIGFTAAGKVIVSSLPAK